MAAKTFGLRVHTRGGIRTVQFTARQLIVAGWAGRDSAHVAEHIQELAEIGVAPPSEIPLYYRVSTSNLTTANIIEVVGSHTSGEVEVVLLDDGSDVYVAIGSDHTDRKLESISVSQSKQVCAKPMSVNVWLLADVADHWDELRIESRLRDSADGEYQSGSVAFLKSPLDLLTTFRERGGTICPGTVMFCGTLPVIGGLQYNSPMQLRLSDPVLGRQIVHRYDLKVLPNLG